MVDYIADYLENIRNYTRQREVCGGHITSVRRTWVGGGRRGWGRCEGRSGGRGGRWVQDKKSSYNKMVSNYGTYCISCRK